METIESLNAECNALAARIPIEVARNIEAVKNGLARELRIEWQDFDSIADLPMTAEIGESLKKQMQGMFALLKRNGIDATK